MHRAWARDGKTVHGSCTGPQNIRLRLATSMRTQSSPARRRCARRRARPRGGRDGTAGTGSGKMARPAWWAGRRCRGRLWRSTVPSGCVV
eukprot:8305052-Lingulodinium_polyedra.AAC.1